MGDEMFAVMLILGCIIGALLPPSEEKEDLSFDEYGVDKVDSTKLAYDSIHGVSKRKIRQRLESGYYNVNKNSPEKVKIDYLNRRIEAYEIQNGIEPPNYMNHTNWKGQFSHVCRYGDPEVKKRFERAGVNIYDYFYKEEVDRKVREFEEYEEREREKSEKALEEWKKMKGLL